MSLRVGVIGAGAMGADHVHTLATSIPSARVSMVFDADMARAEQVAEGVGAGTAASAEELIDSPEVDAVVIASPDHTHATLALACIAADKNVLCEKPLAVTQEDSWAVVEAELVAGRPIVQVGFMRRYDPGYQSLRDAILEQELGTLRVVHCLHRNAAAHPAATSEGIVSNSMIHELDIVRWLVGREVASIEVRSPVAEGLRDPQLATIEMVGGVLVTVEVFVNAAYGYDVQCEAVGTAGTMSLVRPGVVTYKRSGADGAAIPSDFIERFRAAYRAELSAWASASLRGTVSGPTAWDGHVANLLASCGVQSLRSGRRVSFTSPDRPGLYA